MKNLKKILSLVLACIMMTGTIAGFRPMVGAAASTIAVSKGKEVYSRYDPGSNKGETSDGMTNGTHDFSVWWATSSYDAINPVWCIIKLGDQPIDIDGFRIYNSSATRDTRHFNILNVAVAYTNDDSLWKKPLDPADVIDTTKFKTLYESVKDQNYQNLIMTKGTSILMNAPTWPLPDSVKDNYDPEAVAGSGKMNYEAAGDAAKLGFEGYQAFTTGRVKAKYVLVMVTASSEITVLSQIEIVQENKVTSVSSSKSSSTVASTSSSKSNTSVSNTSSQAQSSSTVSSDPFIVTSGFIVDHTAKTISFATGKTITDLKSAVISTTVPTFRGADGNQITDDTTVLTDGIVLKINDLEYTLLAQGGTSGESGLSSQDAKSSISSTKTSSTLSNDTSDNPASGMLWLWITLAVIVIVGGGAAIYFFIIKKRK